MKSRALYSIEAARGWLPWAVLVPFLSIAFVAAPLLAATSVLESFHLADAHGDPIGRIGLIAFLSLPFTLIGLVVLIWVRFVERRSMATIGLVRPGWAPAFAWGHGIGIVTITLVVASVWIAGGAQAAGYGSVFAAPVDLFYVGVLLACFVLQSGVEELLMRGWLLSALARKLNVGLAVAITSLVFAVLHYGPQQPVLVTLNMLLFSVFTCAWALRAGSIWGVMGWHAGWNWMLATGFELPVTGLDAQVPALLVKLTPQGSAILTGGGQGPEGSIICTIFFVAATWLLAVRPFRKREA